MTTVAAPGGMDTETFAAHMTKRHADSLAGLTVLPGNISRAVEANYRIFHNRLHAIRTDLSHDHTEEE